MLNENHGDLLAHLDLPGEIFSSPVVAPKRCGTSGGSKFTVFIGCRDDNLYALNVETIS